MNKRLFLLSIILLFTIVGCSSKSKVNETNKEQENIIKAQDEELNEKDEQLAELVAKVEELEKREEAKELFDDLIDAYNDEDWYKVRSIAKYLNEHFQGLKEDVEAQKLLISMEEEKENKGNEEELIEEEIVVRDEDNGEKLDTRSNVLNSIQILSLYPEKPNSADGVDWYLKIKNNSNKTIKYFDVWVEAINRVGDPAICRIRKKSISGGRFTGPIPSGEVDDGYFSTAWYNNTISRLDLKQIGIEYMDGSQVSFNYEESQYALYNGKWPEGSSNNKKVSNYKFGNVNSPTIVGTTQNITSVTANVRSGPGFDYGIVGELFNGDSVYVYEISYANDRYWCRIGDDNWISIRLLDGTVD